MGVEATNVKVIGGGEKATVSWSVGSSVTNQLEWLVEEKIQGNFVKVARVPITQTTLSVSPVAPGEAEFRVWAVTKQNSRSAKGTVTGKVVEEPPKEEPAAGTWRGYSASNPMPVGVTPYAANCAFNTKVPAAPVVLSNSAAMVANAIQGGAQNLTQRHGYTPIYYASDSDPLVELRTSGSGTSLRGRKIRCPLKAVPVPGGGDAHMVVVQSNGDSYGFWETHPNIAGGYIEANGCGVSNLNTGNGADIQGNAIGAGFGLMAGTIRAQELVAGNIPHALIATLNSTRIGHIPPAVHDDGSSSPDSNVAQEGQLLYLPVSDATIATWGLAPHEVGTAVAAREFGIYVSDKGGGFGIKFEDTTSYQVMGATDPLDAYGKAHSLNQWEGRYVFPLSRIKWSLLQAIKYP